MPHWIFESNELSSTDKLVYALLSGLAFGNEKKECFPSDEYIAKRLGIKRQQANISVANLNKFGALEKRTESHPQNAFKKIRYIHIFLELKKCLPSTENRTLDSTENRTLRSTENRTYSNKGNSNKEKKPSISPKNGEREAFGEVVRLSKEEYQKAKELCGEALDGILEEMNDYCAAHGKKYKDYLAAIRTWWKKRASSPKPMINKIDENAKWAKELSDKMKHVARCHVESNCFVFEGMGNWNGEYIKYSEPSFKDRIINRLRKMGLIDYLKDE